jgi:hypothetical protein
MCDGVVCQEDGVLAELLRQLRQCQVNVCVCVYVCVDLCWSAAYILCLACTGGAECAAGKCLFMIGSLCVCVCV